MIDLHLLHTLLGRPWRSLLPRRRVSHALLLSAPNGPLRSIL